jgi:hypothetical protein
MNKIGRPAVARKLGIFAGGSYGFGQPPGVITLWYADCREYQAALAEHVVSAISPWVFPSRDAARRAIKAGQTES